MGSLDAGSWPGGYKNSLQRVAEVAPLIPKGQAPLSCDDLCNIVSSASASPSEFNGLSTQLLRLFVDSLLRENETSLVASRGLGRVAVVVHRTGTHDEPFITYPLAHGCSETSLRLRVLLSGFESDPERTFKSVHEHLRFDECVPELVQEDFKLFEDVFARAAVTAHLRGKTALAHRIAGASVIFRCPNETFSSLPVPDTARIAELQSAQDSASDELAPLVHLSRKLVDRACYLGERNDLNLLRPMSAAFEVAWHLFSNPEPWRPLTYVARSHVVSGFSPFCDPELALRFPAAEPVLDCIAALKQELNPLCPISSGALAAFLRISSKLTGSSFFCGATLWMKALARLYKMPLAES